jgi:hypothetical protein
MRFSKAWRDLGDLKRELLNLWTEERNAYATGMREPFDSPGYYYMVAMFIAGLLAALPAPRYWWAAVVGIFLGERIYALVMLPETRAWLAFGIVINLLMLSWLPSALGAFVVYLVNRVRMRRSRRGT